MKRQARMLVAAFAVTSSILLTATAHAASPLEPLSAADATLYRHAFAAAQRGDVKTAKSDLAKVSDPSLSDTVLDARGQKVARTRAGQAAREAYYGGNVAQAFQLAAAAGERWIAGLSAFRLNRPADAVAFFDAVANDRRETDWRRAAGDSACG